MIVQVSTIVVLTRRTGATLTQFAAEDNDRVRAEKPQRLRGEAPMSRQSMCS